MGTGGMVDGRDWHERVQALDEVRDRTEDGVQLRARLVMRLPRLPPLRLIRPHPLPCLGLGDVVAQRLSVPVLERRVVPRPVVQFEHQIFVWALPVSQVTWRAAAAAARAWE